MLNALYSLETTSPNGAVRHQLFVAATSETEARNYVLAHEMWGKDGYHVGNASLRGDLNEHDERGLKYQGYPAIVSVGAAR